MQKKLIKIAFFMVLCMIMFLPNCYASTATISANKTEAKAGDTVEVYIDLGIESIAYDLKIELNDKNLVKKREMVSKTGNGNVDKIYLVQVVPEDERIVYEPGTRLATYKYTLADDITENKTLEITVSGDVAGKNSSEKNKVNETISIAVSPKQQDATDDNQEQPKTDDTNKEQPKTDDTNKEQPKTDDTNKEQPKIDDTNKEQPKTDDTNKEQPKTNDTKKEEIPDEAKTTVRIGEDGNIEKQPGTQPKSNTQSPTRLPATGTDKLGIVLIISGLVIIQVVIIVTYKRIKSK